MFVCLFADYHHHYAAHSRYVEGSHELFPMQISCVGFRAIYLSHDVKPKLGEHTDMETYLHILILHDSVTRGLLCDYFT